MSVKVENIISAWSQIIPNFEQTHNLTIKSAEISGWNSEKYIEIQISDKSVFVSADDLICAINNAINIRK